VNSTSHFINIDGVLLKIADKFDYYFFFSVIDTPVNIYIFCDAEVERRLGKPLKYSSDMMYLFSLGNGSLCHISLMSYGGSSCVSNYSFPDFTITSKFFHFVFLNK